ncbi:hypothetical protein JIP4600_90048 [Tenacibaculum maritimum]|nr:hypothetical protein JIP4600_90048 [Tenacibaculum maritimum]
MKLFCFYKLNTNTLSSIFFTNQRDNFPYTRTPDLISGDLHQ